MEEWRDKTLPRIRPCPRVWSKKRAVARKVNCVDGKSKENSKPTRLFIHATLVVFTKRRRYEAPKASYGLKTRGFSMVLHFPGGKFLGSDLRC